MSIDNDVRSVLAADATFSGYMTGGVYTWDTTGPLFISRDNALTSDAFDANSRLRPCCMVKVRSSTSVPSMTDPLPLVGELQNLEIWFYEVDGYDAIENAKQRALVLLHEQCIGRHTLAYSGSPFLRSFVEENFGGAFMIRSDYAALRVNNGA